MFFLHPVRDGLSVKIATNKKASRRDALFKRTFKNIGSSTPGRAHNHIFQILNLA
jgi:hypothetical protein